MVIPIDKKSDIPIKAKKRKELARHELEDYEPGITKEEAMEILEKVATSPKPCRKPDSQPHSTSS